MEISEATIFDLKNLSVLFNKYRMFYGKKSDPEGAADFIRDRIRKQDSVIYIAADENEIAGFVQLYPLFSSVQMKKLWLLNDLYVDEKYRKQGIADALIKKCRKHAKYTNAAGLMLETAADNKEANALYLKEGFELMHQNFYFLKNT
jgi:ribosomal protein S18 acetylase RimI-like enzyme